MCIMNTKSTLATMRDLAEDSAKKFWVEATWASVPKEVIHSNNSAPPRLHVGL